VYSKSMLISHSSKFLSRCLSLSSRWNDTIESSRNFSAILTLVHLSQNIINCIVRPYDHKTLKYDNRTPTPQSWNKNIVPIEFIVLIFRISSTSTKSILESLCRKDPMYCSFISILWDCKIWNFIFLIKPCLTFCCIQRYLSYILKSRQRRR